jgi:hypothetical protein
MNIWRILQTVEDDRRQKKTWRQNGGNDGFCVHLLNDKQGRQAVVHLFQYWLEQHSKPVVEM